VDAGRIGNECKLSDAEHRDYEGHSERN
jgi:hypothetical protein